MSLKINPRREYKIPFEEGDVSFSITFKFKPSEDMDLGKVREKLSQTGDIAKVDTVDYIVRSSITDCEGILDEDTGVEIKPVDEYTQKVLMDIIKGYPEYYTKVLIAYMGPKGKNLKTGVTPQLTPAGEQTTVPNASQPNVETVAS
jgi:hypothetical protein